jgi:hypothetical protein
MGRYLRVMLATLLAVTGVFVLSPSGCVIAGGLVENQSFEEGEGGVPLGWNLTGNATRVDTGPIYEGNWAARIVGAGDIVTQWICVGNLSLPVTYNVWGWVHISGSVRGIIGVDFWVGVNGTQLSATTQLSTNDTNEEYVQLTGTMTAPFGTTCARVRLMGAAWHDEAEVRFDDIGFWLPTGGYCFIATAAYGTETAGELDILRDFRDRVLLKNTLGSGFVMTYYRLSPPVADFISNNGFLRTIVREVFIDPVVSLLQWSQDLWRA